jgi:flagellar hook-associated protein 1 FlgK
VGKKRKVGFKNMAGLFDTFTIAKRGLSVSQSQINTTSHNIANTDTTGYTRQSAMATTTTPYGGNSRFDSCTVGQVGTGAQISSIERIRNSFEDYAVRNQTTINSSLDTQNTYLEQANDIFSDTSTTGLSSALSTFYSAFSSLASSTTATATTSAKNTAISDASTLATTINNKYTSLEDEKSALQKLTQSNVTTMNETLDKITSLNKSIATVTSDGMTPNDLMDTRDNLLDTLSTKFGITVKSEDDNAIDVSATNGTTSTTKLVDSTDMTGSSSLRFSSIASVKYDPADSTNKTLIVTYNKLGDSSNTATITVNATSSDEAATLKTSLEQCGVLVADSTGTVKNGATTLSTTDETGIKAVMFTPSGGEIGGNQTVQSDIQGTMDQLDKYAAALAYTVNAIQTGSTNGTANSNLSNNDPIFVNSEQTTATDTGINAKNISINSALTDDPTLLNCGKTSDSGVGSGTRAQAIKDSSSLELNFSNISVNSSTTRATFLSDAGISFESGSDQNLTSSSTSGSTIGDYYTTLVGSLATKGNSVSSELTTSETQLTSATNARTSTSGVSLDEETTNLIQYQHAYEANAKVISTIDSLLNVVINELTS